MNNFNETYIKNKQRLQMDCLNKKQKNFPQEGFSKTIFLRALLWKKKKRTKLFITVKLIEHRFGFILVGARKPSNANLTVFV